MPTRTTRTTRKPVPTKNAPSKARLAKTATGRRAGKASSAGAPAPTGSKQARLINLLRAPAGATIEQMTTLTGWQAHTVRGTISGVLRKKRGFTVTCTSQTKSGERRYRIVGSAVEA